MQNIRWTDKQLKDAGINKRELKKLLKKFTEIEVLMSNLELAVYGSDNSGYLIHRSHPEHDKDGKADFGAIVADCGLGFDGGGW